MATQADLKASYGKTDKWNDPFVTVSDVRLSKDFYKSLELARFIAGTFPKYVQVAKRTVSHFITQIQFSGKVGDTSERDELKEYLINNLGIMEHMQQAGLEYFIYGNSFIHIYYPFDRYLVDRRNGKYREISVNQFDQEYVSFNINNMTYSVPDPQVSGPQSQKPRVEFEFIDRKSRDSSRIKVRFIDPSRMVLQTNAISGTTKYIYRFEEFFRADVRQGTKMYQINETPKEMLIAIRNDQDFCFNSDSIYHFKNTFISGVSYNGWGVPNILLNYQAIHDTAVLRCINEAVGLDYMLPLRLITPAQTAQDAGTDAALSINLGPWTNAAKNFIINKRKDPTAVHVMPFPIQYQELGGSGRSLAPVDLLKYSEDNMLDGFGFPAELFHMSLQIPQIPLALRMFESTFIALQKGLNGLLKWATRNILNYLDRQQIQLKLALPSVADDMEKRHIWLQLAAGGELSRETAYRAFNIESVVEEARRRAEEDAEIGMIQNEVQQEMERKMTIGSVDQTLQAAMQSQQAPPPGSAAGSIQSPQQPGTTPIDLSQQAEELAVQLLQMEDVGARRVEMNKIKATNEQLYAIVKQKMDEIRQQAASQGRRQAGKG